VAINVDGLDWKRGKWGWLGRKCFYWNAKWVGRICPKGVVTDAQEMQRIYLEEFGTPNVSIPYGANIEKSENPDVVRQYGLEPGRYYLVVSRLVPENNTDLIVQGFTRVNTPRILAIAGNANYRSSFVDRLKETKDPRVKFLGHVHRPEHLKELYCNAYAYLHGHSLGGTNPSLVRALGYGSPILALDTPFNREVLQDYGTLFKKDPDDLARKIEVSEKRPKVIAAYGARAPQRILEAYTWDKITDQYEELFLQLASGQDPTKVHSSFNQSSSYRQEPMTVGAAAGNDS
jgi:glycosyltransferase involved in cell wall biosynthesis